MRSSDFEAKKLTLHENSPIPYYGKVVDLKRGWQICDGTNNTPDLRDQFIRGASNDSQIGVSKNYTTALPKVTSFKIPEYKHSHTLANSGNNYINTEAVPVAPAGMYFPISGGGWASLSTDALSGTTYKVPRTMGGYSQTSEEGSHTHKVSLESAEAVENTRPETSVTGGDTETAPKHVLMYWIMYTGENAPNWNN